MSRGVPIAFLVREYRFWASRFECRCSRCFAAPIKPGRGACRSSSRTTGSHFRKARSLSRMTRSHDRIARSPAGFSRSGIRKTRSDSGNTVRAVRPPYPACRRLVRLVLSRRQTGDTSGDPPSQKAEKPTSVVGEGQRQEGDSLERTSVSPTRSCDLYGSRETAVRGREPLCRRGGAGQSLAQA